MMKKLIPSLIFCFNSQILSRRTV